MPSEVRNQHEPLNNEVIGLHSKWKMFKTLYAEDTSTIDLLNWAAPGAFYFLEQLQLDEIIIAIRRLTDSETTGRGHAQQHNLTLKRLVNTIDATAYPSLRVQADNLLAQVETTCAPIRNYSHKNVAHRFAAGRSGPSRPMHGYQ